MDIILFASEDWQVAFVLITVNFLTIDVKISGNWDGVLVTVACGVAHFEAEVEVPVTGNLLPLLGAGLGIMAVVGITY